MFADDTAIYCSGTDAKEIEGKLNSELARISNLIQANGLAINVTKTEFMVIGTSQKMRYCEPIALFLDDVPIKRVEAYKYLGVIIDPNLSWSPHIDKLCKKASSRIGILKRIMPFLSKSTANLVYNTTISPVFDYCGVVWDSCGTTSATKLQGLQNRAARLILGVNSTTPSDIALHQLGWIPLSDRRQKHKAILMYKYLHCDIEGLNMDLTKYVERHRYNTRNKEDFILPKPRTNQLKRSFKYSTTSIWNSLPMSTRNADNMRSFKSLLMSKT